MDEIEPNRLSAPGEREARARVEAVFAAVDRLSAEALNEAVVPSLDLEDREIRLAELERLADAAGRGLLLDRSRDALKDALLKRFATRMAYPYGTQAMGAARVQDQAAIITALRDLVAVAATRDLIDPGDAQALSVPGLRIVGTADTGGVEVGRLPDHLHDADDMARGAPTAEDWAAAEAGPTAIAAPGATGLRRDPRSVLLLALAGLGVLAIVATRLDRSQVVLGVVLGAIAIVVAWAVFRRRDP